MAAVLEGASVLRIRIAVAPVIALGFAACQVEEAPDNVQTTATSWSPESPKPLMLAVVTTPLRNGVRIEGSTNLPDGTGFTVHAQRGPVWTDAGVTVQGGRFSADLYPRKGQPIPSGAYEIEVSTPFADVQPDSVKAALGPDYKAVTGPLVVPSQFGGRIIEYTAKANIGGPSDPAADKAARKRAYREFEANSRRGCEELPASVERVSGRQKTPSERAALIQSCLRDIPESRRKLMAEGLIEP
jgi:hypothetical protein